MGDSYSPPTCPECGRDALIQEYCAACGHMDNPPNGLTLAQMQAEAWETAEANGFHDARAERGTVLALIHSEVSEALEADREGDDALYAEELADIVIRVADHAESEDIDLEDAVCAKMAENREREFRHGKEY